MLRWKLCEAPLCRQMGMHLDSCENRQECQGCLARVAADGLRLCWPHRDHVEQDAKALPRIYHDIEQEMAFSTGPAAERVSGDTQDGSPVPSTRGMEARSRILAQLTYLVDLIVRESGREHPGASVDQLAEFVAQRASWLAAHPIAPEAVTILRDLAWGEPWRVAYPTGNKLVDMGPCPRDLCEGELVAVLRTASSLPAEVKCKVNRAHSWPMSRWVFLQQEQKCKGG